MITLNEVGDIDSELDDLLLPYTFDLLIFDNFNHANLREHIERVGKIFYERGQGFKLIAEGVVVAEGNGTIHQ
jgi:hypothetical protein